MRWSDRTGKMLRALVAVFFMLSLWLIWVHCGNLPIKKKKLSGWSTTEQCTVDEFQCDNGLCMSLVGRCNGVDDCFDGSDEFGCDYRLCEKPAWFRCRHDDRCIAGSLVCDGHWDCLDGEDETGRDCAAIASQASGNCGQFRFACVTSKLCIPVAEVCDGFPHCDDGSDETLGCLLLSLGREDEEEDK